MRVMRSASRASPRLEHEKLSPQPQSLPPLMERSALFLGFNDDSRIADERHCPISLRKVAGPDLRSRRELRHTKMITRDFGLYCLVGIRIDLVDRRSENGDRPTSAVHRRAVRRVINTRSQPAYDHDTGLHKFARKPCRSPQPFIRRLSRAYDGHTAILPDDLRVT